MASSAVVQLHPPWAKLGVRGCPVSEFLFPDLGAYSWAGQRCTMLPQRLSGKRGLCEVNIRGGLLNGFLQEFNS